MTARKIFLFILCIVVCPAFAAAQDEKIFQGYSGGMMLHAGYLFGENTLAPKSPQGATFGIGGAIRVHLWKHFRLGTEGYMSNMPMQTTDCRNDLQKGSYIRYGWGGLLADACWRMDKVWPYVGATVGGGTVKSLYIVDGSQNDWKAEPQTIFNKRGFVCLAPFVGCDYLLTPRVHLTFKADWMLAFGNGKLLMPTGLRAYIGFMFCH